MSTLSKKPRDPKPPWFGHYFGQISTILHLSCKTLSQFFHILKVILYLIILPASMLPFQHTILLALESVRQEVMSYNCLRLPS